MNKINFEKKQLLVLFFLGITLVIFGIIYSFQIGSQYFEYYFYIIEIKVLLFISIGIFFLGLIIIVFSLYLLKENINNEVN